jgi:hypothetical protein
MIGKLEDIACRLKVENGVYFLCTPSGEKIPLQRNLVVVQDLDISQGKMAWARITLMVKLEDTK